MTVFADFSLDLDSNSKKIKLPDSVNRRLLMRNEFGAKLAEFLNLSIDKGPWLAGGAVRKMYLGQNIGLSDWDIWFSSPEQFHQSEKLMCSLDAAWAVHGSDNAISFKYSYNNQEHNVQLVKRRFFDHPGQIIRQFDFTICQLLTDGDTLMIGDQTALDLESKTIRLASYPMQNYIISRLVKYMVYGYYPSQELIELITEQSININWKDGQNDYDAS